MSELAGVREGGRGREGDSENFSVARTPWHVTHNYYGNVQPDLPSQACCNYNNAPIILLTVSPSHTSALECGDTRRLKLINPRNNWGYWAEVNQLDWAEEQSVAPHHPADHWLQQALTLLTRCRSRQCSPAGLTYPEHDLICFSSSFDWIIFDSQPMPGSLSASHFLTVLI